MYSKRLMEEEKIWTSVNHVISHICISIFVSPNFAFRKLLIFSICRDQNAHKGNSNALA